MQYPNAAMAMQQGQPEFRERVVQNLIQLLQQLSPGLAEDKYRAKARQYEQTVWTQAQGAFVRATAMHLQCVLCVGASGCCEKRCCVGHVRVLTAASFQDTYREQVVKKIESMRQMVKERVQAKPMQQHPQQHSQQQHAPQQHPQQPQMRMGPPGQMQQLQKQQLQQTLQAQHGGSQSGGGALAGHARVQGFQHQFGGLASSQQGGIQAGSLQPGAGMHQGGGMQQGMGVYSGGHLGQGNSSASTMLRPNPSTALRPSSSPYPLYALLPHPSSPLPASSVSRCCPSSSRLLHWCSIDSHVYSEWQR